MANKHFTTNGRITAEQRQRVRELRDIRASRLQRERERQQLLELQRTFNQRGGRVVA